MSQTGVANTQPSMEQPDNVTFVLVHCAFGGGWAWKYVAPLLRQRGHRVYAPSLTGLGERVHHLSIEGDLVDKLLQMLQRHVQATFNVPEFPSPHGGTRCTGAMGSGKPGNRPQLHAHSAAGLRLADTALLGYKDLGRYRTACFGLPRSWQAFLSLGEDYLGGLAPCGD